MTVIDKTTEPNEQVTDFLEHYGVKGMKWGRTTRSNTSSGSSTKEGPSEDASKAQKSQARVKTSGTQALSNQDLQHLVNRMNLEQQYSRLSTGQSSLDKLKKGQTKVNAILSVGKTINEIHTFMNSPLGKAVKTTLGK